MTTLLFKTNANTENREFDIRDNDNPTLNINMNGTKIPIAREDMNGVSESSILNRIPTYRTQNSNDHTALQNQINELLPKITLSLLQSVQKQIGIDSGSVELSLVNDTVIGITLNGTIFTGTGFNEYSAQYTTFNITTIDGIDPAYNGTIYIYFDGTFISGYTYRLPTPLGNMMLLGSMYVIGGIIQSNSLVNTPHNTRTSRDERVANTTQVSGLIMTPSSDSHNFELTKFNYGVEGINWINNNQVPNQKIVDSMLSPEWTRIYPHYVNHPIDNPIGAKWFDKSDNTLKDVDPNKYYIFIPCIVPTTQLLFLAPQVEFDSEQEAVNAIIKEEYNLEGISSRITFFGFCFIYKGSDSNNTSNWTTIGQLPIQLYSLPASSLGPQSVLQGLALTINNETNTDINSVSFQGFQSNGPSANPPTIINGTQQVITALLPVDTSFNLDWSRSNLIQLAGQSTIFISSTSGTLGSLPSFEAIVTFDNTAVGSVDCTFNVLPTINGSLASGVNPVVKAGSKTSYFILNGIVYGPQLSISPIPPIEIGKWKYTGKENANHRLLASNLVLNTSYNLTVSCNLSTYLPDTGLYEVIFFSFLRKDNARVAINWTLTNEEGSNSLCEHAVTNSGSTSFITIQLRRTNTLNAIVFYRDNTTNNDYTHIQPIAYRKIMD